MKRKKAELGGIWPKAIKHTAFSSFTFFTLEKMNRIEKVEGVGGVGWGGDMESNLHYTKEHCM